MGGVEFCTTGREADNVEPHMWPQLRGLSSLRCVTPEHVALRDCRITAISSAHAMCASCK
jgi:hypothetical protein